MKRGSTNNLKPFSYVATWGTVFECEYSDFRTPILTSGSPKSVELRMRDVAEMAGYHGVNIWHTLNGFQGYDTIRFKEK